MPFALVYEECHFREHTQETQNGTIAKITATKRLKCSHLYLLTHDIRATTLAVMGEHIWAAAIADVVAFLDKWVCLSPSLWGPMFFTLGIRHGYVSPKHRFLRGAIPVCADFSYVSSLACILTIETQSFFRASI